MNIPQKNHPLFHRWNGMMVRCYCRSATNYKFYGGRSITVDERWRGAGGFANFVADMGAPPTPGMTLDRIDNDGPYSPENCRWATRRTQTLNSRATVWITIDGATRCAGDWARHIGVDEASVRRRVKICGDYETAIRSYAAYPNGSLSRLSNAARRAALR